MRRVNRLGTRRWPNAGLMLGQRRNKPAKGERLVTAGYAWLQYNSNQVKCNN